MKKMKLNIVKTMSILLLVIALMIIGGVSSLAEAKPLVIGVTQIVEHPALDAARDGFIAALEEAGFKEGVDAVSYTHLRAHETRHDIVCRLLLEKKKKKKK